MSRMGRLFRRPDERYAEIVGLFTPEEMEWLCSGLGDSVTSP